MGFLWSLIVGGFIGAIAGSILNKDKKMGIVANVLAGFVGSSVGQSLFGSFGPKLADMAIIPSLLGAIIVISVVSFVLKKGEK